jgi:hypothetical protein
LFVIVISALPTAAAGEPFVINEVVTDPQHDWGDSSDLGGNNTPFDGLPGEAVDSGGGGEVTVSDEYVELKNVSAVPQSLKGYRLTMHDTSPVYDCFQFDSTPTPGTCSSAQVYRVLDASGTEVTTGTVADRLQEVPAGGYVVIGNPSGSMNNTISLELYDTSLAATVDTITVDGNADSAANETASRLPDGTDTDDDAVDLVRIRATVGTGNGEYCAVQPGDVVINEVVTDPQHDWSRDSGGTPFDGIAGTGDVTSADEFIELKNVSGAAQDLSLCILEMIDTTPESLLLGADDTVIRVFPTGSLDSVPDGGYVVIGDPPGTMNNTGVIQLLGATHIDGQSFGSETDDAPGLNAESAGDEAGARVPDGVDTGAGADFAKQLATPGATNELDECALGLAHCDAFASCRDTAAGFECVCPSGYALDAGGGACSDIDECSTGTHDCHANAACTNTEGSFTCACSSGFAGDGRTCADIDECTAGTHDCDANTTCSNTTGSFDCTCNAGFGGDPCTDIDECTAGTHDCHANATCSNTPGSFDCTCDAGFGGDPCTDIDECTAGTHDCHADAVCTNTPGSFTCTCKAGTTGNGRLCTLNPSCGGCGATPYPAVAWLGALLLWRRRRAG